MDRKPPQLHTSVHDTLNDWPETASLFRAFKTACIGCYLARFCSLQDVADTYHIQPEALMEAVRKATQDSKLLIRSER
jgi:NAD(P)H-hydrate repair Nnr-like enzyme with NAD(P)H-hydrate dehydratase domain